MKFWISSILIVIIAATLLGGAVVQPASAAATIPTFDIIAVVKDTSVTVKTANFPASRTFDVRMGKIGTKGINGILVGSTDTGSGGSITATYAIPADLKGQGQIAIRMDSKTGGYFSFNWFNNSSFGTPGSPVATPTPGGPTPTKPAATAVPGGSTPTKTATAKPNVKIPTFKIDSVVKDSKVTITAVNFPANQQFDVRMGKMFTQGVNGTLVTTQNSGATGAFSATYDIPAGLKGQSRISIRLENKTSGYFSYNWFWNNNAP